MHIQEYQAWLQAYDEARGWDMISPSHSFLHLVEEIGEIAREAEYLYESIAFDGFSIGVRS
jgi:NTP pyrophosphatase (non-canonical NTP hydrolase)